MSIHEGLSGPLSGGIGGGPNSRDGIAVRIDGRSYFIEPSLFQRETVAATRPPSDDGAEPTEASLNPDAAWRRVMADWSWGAGQEFFDEPQSDRRRFFDSRRLDVLSVPNQVSVLPATTLVQASVAATPLLAATTTRLYAAAGTSLRWDTAPEDGFASSETLAATITGLATFGDTIYIAQAGQILRRSVAGAATANFGTYTADGCAVAIGRLFAWDDAALVEVGAAGATTAVATLTLGNWGGVCDSPAGALAWTDRDLRLITVNETTGALNAPVVIASLPTDEIINEVIFYLGFIVLATSRGFRIATLGGQGAQLGALVDSPGACHSLLASGRHVWVGGVQRDASTGAAWRVDLGRFTEPDLLVAAYASDLETAGAGTVTGLARFAGRLWLAVGAQGFFLEALTPAADGWLETSKVRYSTYESKLFANLALGCDPLTGSITASYRTETTDDWTQLAVLNEATSTTTAQPWSFDNLAGEHLQLRFALVDAVLRRALLRAYPQPSPVDRITLAVFAKPTLLVGSGGGRKKAMDVTAALDHLRSLRGASRVVSFEIGDRLERVLVEAVGMQGERWDRDRSTLTGLIPVVLKTVEAS